MSRSNRRNYEIAAAGMLIGGALMLWAAWLHGRSAFAISGVCQLGSAVLFWGTIACAQRRELARVVDRFETERR